MFHGLHIPLQPDGDLDMKRLLLALLCVACTGTAWAQTGMALPATQPSVVVLSVQKGTPTPVYDPIQQVSGGRFFAGPGCCGTACPTTCATSCPTCIAVPAIKVHTKICYSSVCEKVCFKDCSSFFGRCNSGCDQGKCEAKVYTQKYLVKRVHTTECETTKCVPACDNCHGGVVVQPRFATPGVETIPTQPLPAGKK
jgi:hypothetical protein